MRDLVSLALRPLTQPGGLARFWRGLGAVTMLIVASANPVLAQAPVQKRVLGELCAKGVSNQVKGITNLLASVDAGQVDPSWGVEIFQALGDRALICGGDTPLIVSEDTVRLATTLEPTKRSPEKKQGAFVNLRLRSQLDMGVAILRLLSEPGGPTSAADLEQLRKRAEIAPVALIERAVAMPGNEAVAEGLRDILAVAALEDPDPAQRISAIKRLAEAPSARNLTLLLNLRDGLSDAEDGAIKGELSSGINKIRFWLEVGEVSATIYSGLSYASILFMAALGLAVIFGLMGVINLAQGELIMIGAYVTFLVQEALKVVAPGLLEYYLLLAIPFAFVVTAGVGVTMEVTVIRHLYRRPLMTLLATWAISLFLINATRVVFGTQNLEFVVPGFLSGGVHLFADFIVTWNRLFAICFALVVLGGALFVLRYTKLGMFIRAVTENRDMAGCVGVSVRRVDMVAFGIGSGLAGLAGLALSPIYTVNPGMGASFIVDAFMIVVLGGVGSLIGTAAAALGIGMINVIIEPLYGAVAAKVIVLLMIIVFIQFRPEGLIAIKGRR
ncbi:urea ABC transporter permease subunit UrtB [Roseibium algicola]|uniref:Urea ABC transporter permease subunit UrtB n=2 Tax=Roseibium algicola TaxID=2857014 RepID=A0ABM6I0K9_9HYPH|nr:urea ABC transporter permease subunit UrtB [Roseibium aggregatum]